MSAAAASFDRRRFVANLTHRPGVYRMFDAGGELIYAGKAKDLRKRVASYFSGRAKDAKTMALVEQIASMEVTVTNTETEALILEHTLIKRHRPRFNVVLRDDKSYPWVYVNTGHSFPRLGFHRGARNRKGRYFGPYPSAGSVRKTLNELQKLFLVRQCTDSFFANRSRPCLQYQIKRCSAPCVGLVSEEDYRRDVEDAILFLEGRNARVIDSLAERMESAAEELRFEAAARYRDQIARLKRVDSEQFAARDARIDLDVVALATRETVDCVAVMFVRAGRLLGSRTYFPRTYAPGGARGTPAEEVMSAFLSQYYLEREAPPEIVVDREVETAGVLAATLAERAGRHVQIKFRVRGDRARWLEMARTNAEQGAGLRVAGNANLQTQLESLADALGLDELPQRMECFDVSHTGGEAAVAACVVFGPTGPLKAEYRRFNIRGAAAGDDYAAMGEALERRYRRLKKGEAPLPDVLFIDGGKGQLSRAEEVLAELGVDGVALVGVAKGRARRAGAEQLFLAGAEHALILADDSPARLLIQQIRDEAHRFAITGHRQRRARARKSSGLEAIPGLGPKRRKELLRQFGGMQGVARAGIDDLVKVRGISRALAERIYGDFHDRPGKEERQSEEGGRE